MPKFDVEYDCTCKAYHEFDAEDEDDALAQALLEGPDLVSVVELQDCTPVHAERVGP